MPLVRIVLPLFIFLALSSSAFCTTSKSTDHESSAIAIVGDSTNIHLKGLGDVLHRADSLLSSLKGKHFNFHIDSMSFGPFTIPEIHIPKFDIPEFNIHIPDTVIPSQSIPKIQIPEINRDISIDSEWSGNVIINSDSPETSSLSGQAEIASIIPTSEPHYTKHYYFDGKRQYYINNPLWAYAERSIEGRIKIEPVER